MRRALALVVFAVALGLTPATLPEALAGKGRASKKVGKREKKKSVPAVKLNKKAEAEEPEEAPAETATAAAPTRGPTRIDFDDRLIQGQTNKSGAVYLYDRKELKTRSMVKKRESFREEIVGSVYDS